MVAKINSFIFLGVKTVDIQIEVKIQAGMPAFNIVGLADKAVNESKERVRSAINSLGLSFPAKRITVNLTPANIEKDGNYFDLPIALGILMEMEILPYDCLDDYIVMGELSLDGYINHVNGILPATMSAVDKKFGIICPEKDGSEALWVGNDIDIIAPKTLHSLISHLKGIQQISRPEFKKKINNPVYLDMKDVVGQSQAKRALEISATGAHNLLMVGSPGTGKSMLAKRILGILPDLTLTEILEINMINSIAGNTKNGELIMSRPFMDPHHSCSMSAMVGGGTKSRAGQISLAHKGILFLDELPEFPRQVLDSLRQPMENGNISVARASQNVVYPAQFQLIAAMNPCRCGYFMDEGKRCSRAPLCAKEYQAKISGPLLDRIDIFVDVPRIDIFKESKKNEYLESSEEIKKRVIKARKIQAERYKNTTNNSLTNANATSDLLKKFVVLDDDTQITLEKAIDFYGISMRGYSKILKVARTIADLDDSEKVQKNHILEALKYRRAEAIV